MNKNLTVSDLANLVGVSPDAVRYYERLGLRLREIAELARLVALRGQPARLSRKPRVGLHGGHGREGGGGGGCRHSRTRGGDGDGGVSELRLPVG
jgi:hypothetical protein